MTSVTVEDPHPRRGIPARTNSERRQSSSAAPERAWYIRAFTGRREDPRRARPALWGLVAVTAFLYLYELTISGYANEFYAASVKSSTQSWRAWLWASLDSQLSITVDKPPAAIWLMGLSARILGFSSFSLLLPNALMGVATVALSYGAVRRLSGHLAGLIAGAVVAVTPVAALMFRFDNPDAMLVACLTAAAYMVVRALQTERGRTALWWLIGAGWLIGLAFLTKMLQGVLILPALGLVYLMCARRGWWTRIWHLLVATASMVVSAGWLIALCAVWPASSRPYIGGSENNSLWELALGYNGLGRVLGGDGNRGGGGAGGGNASFGGEAGLLRMVNSAFATEISWLLPAALLLLVAGLIARGRRPLHDRHRAGIMLWGASMVVTALVFSVMQGTIHPYYAVALAPLIGGTIGSGAAALWPGEGDSTTVATLKRVCLAVAVVLTGAWGFHLLGVYASGWQSWIRWLALIGSLAGAIVFLVAGSLRSPTGAIALKRIAVGALLVGSLAAVVPTSAWTAATVVTAHSGSTPTSGPAGMSGSGMGRPGGAAAGSSRQRPAVPGGSGSSGESGAQGSSEIQNGSGRQGSPGAQGQTGQQGRSTGGTTARGGGMGGTTSSNTALVKLLNSAGTKWSAAVVGDQTAAGYILSTDTAVFSIGGWSGSDNNITLAQFKQYVADGKIRYFIGGGGMGGRMGGGTTENSSSGAPTADGASGSGSAGTGPSGSGTGEMGQWGGSRGTGAGSTTRHRGTGGSGGAESGASSAITSWVTSTFTARTVGGVTVYDLTSAKS
ncbi:glycosyl transferase [Acidipropionibacterium jensenii]|uniref:ArnT family glycosyltransferase n=1 Tax=Acidipropionibacterium jensenii TaxID=1749 RepID=UPI000BC339F9|nr:glycosyltransferase family 39 protein [Acidipropionibacterium jensenii]AZZ41459.1 glycosyl transferase [Acidipropionibacterium jensenii]